MQCWCMSEKDRVRVSGRSKKSGSSGFALTDNCNAPTVDESEKRARKCEDQSYQSSVIADFTSRSPDCLALGPLP